jgi:hypothetical protein
MSEVFIVVTLDDAGIEHLEVLDGRPTWVPTARQTFYVANINGGDSLDVTPARPGLHDHVVEDGGDECVICGELICVDCGHVLDYADGVYRHRNGSACWLHEAQL